MKITKEQMALLRKELEEYEETTPMTDEERSVLHEWVDAGNSVHDNSADAVYEGGRTMDFLDVYREEEYIREKLDSLEGAEKEKYLRELRGEQNEDDLREECSRYWFIIGVYEQVLRRYGLMSEAEAEIQAAEKRSEEFSRSLQESHGDVKLPFDGRCLA